MRKPLLIFAAILALFIQKTIAQEVQNDVPEKKEPQKEVVQEEQKEIIKPEMFRDRLVVDVFHTFWLGAPNEMNNRKFNPGFNVSMLWDFKSKPASPMSFGLGVGCQYHTLFSDAILQKTNDDVMKFYVLPETFVEEHKPDIARMTYISCYIPLELRYRNTNGFKFTLGARLGLIAEISQRYKGLDFNDSSTPLNYKNYDITGKQQVNFDIYLRCGWQFVSVYYSYQVNKLFNEGSGPAMQPMTLGVSFSIF